MRGFRRRRGSDRISQSRNVLRERHLRWRSGEVRREGILGMKKGGTVFDTAFWLPKLDAFVTMGGIFRERLKWLIYKGLRKRHF